MDKWHNLPLPGHTHYSTSVSPVQPFYPSFFPGHLPVNIDQAIFTAFLNYFKGPAGLFNTYQLTMYLTSGFDKTLNFKFNLSKQHKQINKLSVTFLVLTVIGPV